MYPSRALSFTVLLVAATLCVRPAPADLNPCGVKKIHDIWNGGAHDMLGTAVAVSGETTVVGIPGDDLAGVRSGSVYVFWNNGIGGLSLEAILYPPGRADGDLFGNAVAIDNNVIVVGAPENDDNGDGCGATYVFRYWGSRLMTTSVSPWPYQEGHY